MLFDKNNYFCKNALALLKNGNADQAIKMAKRYMRISPNSIDSTVLLGYIYYLNDDNENAVSYFKQAVYQVPDNCDYLSMYLITCVLTDKDDAKEAYFKLSDRKNNLSLIACGYYFYYKCKYNEALDAAYTGLSSSEYYFEALMLFCLSSFASGSKMPDAVKFIESESENLLNSKIEKIYIKLLYKNNQKNECKKYCKKLIAKNPNSDNVQFANQMVKKITDSSKPKELENTPVKTNTKIQNVKTDNLDEAFGKLDSLIGLNSVKQQIHKLHKKILFNKERSKILEVEIKDDSGYHFVFSGNPGTGKTTVARLLGDIFLHIGLLSKGHLVETDRSGLVGEYQGHTAVKTKKIVEEALGGVLFIDEAYSLMWGDHDDFGREAIDTLVKCVEDNRDNLVVILAGYREEMNEFVKANIGLESRFTKYIDFPDYSEEELLEIAEDFADKQHFILSENGKRAFCERISKEKVNKKFGNARTVRNIINEAIEEKANIDLDNRLDIETLTTLTESDFGIDLNEFPEYKAQKYINELQQLIGLKNVKEDIENIIATVKYQKEEFERTGIKEKPLSLHMAFTGNPGTGKTTVARIYGNLLREAGILKKGQFIEVTRSDLVGKYLGHTAKIVKEKCEDAYGGILFIDEAYALCRGERDEFGKEAVDTLIKEMEDNRDKFAVIFAGYSKEMNAFFDSNSGFQSRISKNIEFPDYSFEELIAILIMYVNNEQYTFSDDGIDAMNNAVKNLYENKNHNFGNARDIRKLFEKVKANLRKRVVYNQVQGDERRAIIGEDFRNVN